MPASQAALIPAESPWLEPVQQRLALSLLASYRRAFQQPLLRQAASGRSASQALFAASTVVLAHDGSDPASDPGPRLIYANAAALSLWRRPWTEMVGMPSRLTAAAPQRADRARLLSKARSQHAISGYCGERITSQGRRFQIHNARLWTLWDEHGNACGQAAAFNSWWWL